MATVLVDNVKLDIDITEKIKASTSVEDIIKDLGKLTDKFSSIKKVLSNAPNTRAYKSAMKKLSGDMNGLEKGVTGAVAAFSEFNLVKDGIYDIVKGSDNLLASIGQIGGSAVAASVEMCTVFGPAGIVAGGVTALIAAFLGVESAMDAVVDESTGNSIRDALLKPGGVPIEEITNKYTFSLGQISEGFTGIVSATDELQIIKARAGETSSEIDLIKFAFENGTTVSGQKIAELEELFNQLYDDSQEIFSKEYDIIMLGLAGALGDVASAAGILVPEIMQAMDDLNTKNETELEELKASNESLKESYESGTITQEAYWESLYANTVKLQELTGECDKVTASIDEMNEITNGIDFSALVESVNGVYSLNIGEIGELISGVGVAYSDASETISTATESTLSAINKYMESAENYDMPEYVSLFEQLASLESASAEEAQKELETQMFNFIDTIQTGLTQEIPDVIDQALADYQNLSSFQRKWVTEEEYVKEALLKYKTNVIEPAETELQSMYEQLGLDGTVWASEAAETLINH